LANYSGGQQSVFEFGRGSITIDSSCTSGDIAVGGAASIIDNSAGATIDTTNLIQPADVTQIKQKTATLPIVIPI